MQQGGQKGGVARPWPILPHVSLITDFRLYGGRKIPGNACVPANALASSVAQTPGDQQGHAGADELCDDEARGVCGCNAGESVG